MYQFIISIFFILCSEIFKVVETPEVCESFFKIQWNSKKAVIACEFDCLKCAFWVNLKFFTLVWRPIWPIHPICRAYYMCHLKKGLKKKNLTYRIYSRCCLAKNIRFKSFLNKNLALQYNYTFLLPTINTNCLNLTVSPKTASYRSISFYVYK